MHLELLNIVFNNSTQILNMIVMDLKSQTVTWFVSAAYSVH